jgi:hypothetical protein
MNFTRKRTVVMEKEGDDKPRFSRQFP